MNTLLMQIFVMSVSGLIKRHLPALVRRLPISFNTVAYVGHTFITVAGAALAFHQFPNSKWNIHAKAGIVAEKLGY